MFHLRRPFYFQEDWEDAGETARERVRDPRTRQPPDPDGDPPVPKRHHNWDPGP